MVLLLGCASAACGAPRGPFAERSCEAWQADAEQLGHPTLHPQANIVGSQPVTVYAAPAGFCRCAGSVLQPSAVVQIDRQFRGFVRVLYLNAAAGEQVSGWVKSTQLRQIRANKSPPV
jgi:hypothetical protein